MLVIDSTDTTHEIYVPPRSLSTGVDMRLRIKDEDGTTYAVITPNTIIIVNQYLRINFDLSTSEGKTYELKIYDNDDDTTYYRGKITATAQVKQEYKING